MYHVDWTYCRSVLIPKISLCSTYSPFLAIAFCLKLEIQHGKIDQYGLLLLLGEIMPANLILLNLRSLMYFEMTPAFFHRSGLSLLSKIFLSTS